MFKQFRDSFVDGVARLFKSPQLFYTIGVGIVILLSFIFVSQRFLGIAQQSQERLFDITGSTIHDGFAPFVEEHLNEPALLTEKIENIIERNPVITEFMIAVPTDDGPRVLATNGPVEISDEYRFIIDNIKTEIGQSYRTGGTDEGGSRIFRQVVAVSTDDDPEVEAYVLTGTVLSEADRMIQENIQLSLIILIVVIAVIMFLFFMHSRIIDYAYLYKKLQSVDQMKDDFISMASHELRTPLTVIRGYAAELTESGHLAEGDKEYVNRINISASRLADLVNDMLDVARIEQGRMSFEFSQFNPHQVISEIVDSFVPVAKDKGLRVTYAPKQSAITVVDKKRLEQVLVNIIGNAVKYTKEGSVTVQTDVVDNGQFLEIRTIDTGIGMSSREQNNLFKKFYRVKNDDTSQIQGTGLGLWITKQIVEQMHGEITVESIKGVGTHFVLRFPVSK